MHFYTVICHVNVKKKKKLIATAISVKGEIGTKLSFNSHFFLAASRFGAETFTLPGMFLDRSASCV